MREREREIAHWLHSHLLCPLHVWRSADTFTRRNTVCLHTVWQSAKTNSSCRQQTLTLALLERTQLILHQRECEGQHNGTEDKQRKTTQICVHSLMCASYLSLLNLREWRMAGLFCLRFHRWILSSARALTSAPCQNKKENFIVIHQEQQNIGRRGAIPEERVCNNVKCIYCQDILSVNTTRLSLTTFPGKSWKISPR